jgi:DNA polymerase-3 subunit delta'
MSRVLEELAAGRARFPGSLLLTGDSDERVESEAKRLAARLLCPGGDPEDACSACRRVLSGIHPDLLVVEPEGVQIRVERIREALAFGAGRPYEAPRRVAIVSRADLLGDEGANALLKSLEEPGRDLHWILTTTRPELLLPTIRSRCAAVALAPRTRGDREKEWRERGFSAADAADLARAAAGPDEAPQERLEEYRGRRAAVAEALAHGLARRSLPALLMLAEDLARGEDRELATIAAEMLADAAIGLDAPPVALRHAPAASAMREIAAAVPAEALRRAVLKAVDAPPDTRRGNLRMHWEALLLEMWEAGGKA